MSYEVTFGADETCGHGHYWRSCALCSTIGPRATEAQIQARTAQNRLEQEAERKCLRLYVDLDEEEKIAAEALWDTLGCPSRPPLANAVRGIGDPFYIGRGRTVCVQARTAVAAWRQTRIIIPK